MLTKLTCRLFGHHVDNHVFRAAAHQDRTCRCGSSYLREDGSLTHVRHTLSCFLGTHAYEPLVVRDGHHEYVCTQCGHTLLFPGDGDPYSGNAAFRKKVRYLCGLFGHHVGEVTMREGFTEYACFCGHSFLKDSGITGKVRHPAVCVLTGHSIRFLRTRDGYAEYVCVDCGHPFCFNAPGTPQPAPPHPCPPAPLHL